MSFFFFFFFMVVCSVLARWQNINSCGHRLKGRRVACHEKSRPGAIVIFVPTEMAEDADSCYRDWNVWMQWQTSSALILTRKCSELLLLLLLLLSSDPVSAFCMCFQLNQSIHLCLWMLISKTLSSSPCAILGRKITYLQAFLTC